MEELDYTLLYQAYSAKGRNPAVDPKTTFKTLTYAYSQNIYLLKVHAGICGGKSGYESEVTVYKCDDCSGCPYKEACIKAKGNKSKTGEHHFIQAAGIDVQAFSNHQVSSLSWQETFSSTHQRPPSVCDTRPPPLCCCNSGDGFETIPPQSPYNPRTAR